MGYGKSSKSKSGKSSKSAKVFGSKSSKNSKSGKGSKSSSRSRRSENDINYLLKMTDFTPIATSSGSRSCSGSVYITLTTVVIVALGGVLTDII